MRPNTISMGNVFENWIQKEVGTTGTAYHEFNDSPYLKLSSCGKNLKHIHAILHASGWEEREEGSANWDLLWSYAILTWDQTARQIMLNTNKQTLQVLSIILILILIWPIVHHHPHNGAFFFCTERSNHLSIFKLVIVVQIII